MKNLKSQQMLEFVTGYFHLKHVYISRYSVRYKLRLFVPLKYCFSFFNIKATRNILSMS